MTVYLDLSRRELLKQMAAAWTAMVASAFLPGCGGGPRDRESILADKGVTWSKAPCRFCGVGCGVMVGVRDGKVVAVAGDRQSPVNVGLLCVKGYHLPGILYGRDRITRPLIRKNGKLVAGPSMDDALSLVAKRFAQIIKEHGPDAVAVYGSGQWTIQDGYAASKWLRAGVGTNNIEANARLCMASAVTGFLTTFGKDEPMGCYDDFDQGDVFVFWGNNSAEMHPVLFSRILKRKERVPQVRLVEIATRYTRTSEACDLHLEMLPQSDLAIANAIAHEIVDRGWVNQEFVRKHTLFKRGEEDIGYGLRGESAKNPLADRQISFGEYKRFLREYTPEYAQEVSGVPARHIREVAALYGNPRKKIVSLWCMGLNQHTRGTWINNLVYNLHLLTGKISEPGNGPFSLTGQPSACGTVREVGTLTHALPGGRRVDRAEHRRVAAKIWNVPVESLPAKPSSHTISMFRKLAGGQIKAILIQVTNPMVTLPDLNFFREGISRHKPFIVVSDVYPTPTTEIADVVLPAAMWVEREGCFGNSERRTQHWDRLVNPPGEAMPDSQQIIELAKRMGYGQLFPWATEEEQARGLYEEYRQFTLGVGKDVAAYDELKRTRGLRWPVVKGRETRWRYREGSDPYVKEGRGWAFYGNRDLEERAVIWQRPYQPAAEEPDREFPFWLTTGRVLEHWHTGSMTRRVVELHRAMPEAYVEINPEDARELALSDGAQVRVISRRGSLTLKASVGGRASPARGSLFIPFFDEALLANLLTLDAYCPISKQPDYKKCAVKVEKG